MSTSSNFILEEIIADLVDSNKSLVGPLMRLQYFAKRTGNEELMQFVLSELNGYKGKANMPDYRMAGAIIKVDIQFGETKHSDLELPVEMLPQDKQHLFSSFYLNESVAVLEEMVVTKEQSKDFSQYLVLNLPLQMTSIFKDAAVKLYRIHYYRADVIGVRLLTNRNLIPRALTVIRSRLLDFCMEIGEQFGYNIVIDSFNKYQSSNNEKILQIMSTVINNHGDGSIINTGENANIHATINISKGNKEQLNESLKRLGVDAEDIEELNAIVVEEVPDSENKRLGNKTVDWISEVSGKALKGVGGIAKEVTSSLLANLLMQYFGIPPIN